jgi:hypothetical protein
MNIQRILIAFLFLDFAAFTGYVIAKEGLLGFIPNHTTSLWSIQVLLDLCIAAAFGSVWMWRDAKKRGVNPLPWVLAVPFTGSLALLAYAALRPGHAPEPALTPATR